MEAEEETAGTVLPAEQPEHDAGDADGGTGALDALLSIAKLKQSGEVHPELEREFAALARIQHKLAALRHACASERQFRLLVQAATGDGPAQFESHVDDLLEMASRDALPKANAAESMAYRAVRTDKGLHSVAAKPNRKERRAATRAQRAAERARRAAE